MNTHLVEPVLFVMFLFYSLYFLLPGIIHPPLECQLREVSVFVVPTVPRAGLALRRCSVFVQTNAVMSHALSFSPPGFGGYDAVTVPISHKTLETQR